MRMSIVALGLAMSLVVPLSGCGLVGMVASGVSDGTKYVINRIDEGQQAQTGPQVGHEPAGESAVPAQTTPVQPSPMGGHGTVAPAPLTAPVTPVTRGVPVN
jgi:hypothetical protein